MLLDDTPKYDEAWGRVYNELGFKPGMRESVPFTIAQPHCVFGIADMSNEQLDKMEIVSREIFARVTPAGGRVYALDWQHSVSLYDPRNPDEQKDFWVEDARYWGGGYNFYFPSFYPDGDYYFFIAEDFSFGFLGHPWRQEVWIFGEELISEFEAVYKELGWTEK